jgi:uncharacterized protein (TIGR02118 family)
MYRMTILYGIPEDPERFRRYYHDQHVPLARRMRGLTGWNLCWVDDPTDAAPYILIAELYAADKASMDRILASPAGRAARDDLKNFVTGPVTFLQGAQEEVPL